MRAKKIENKPKVNEVVSDAVEVKRMKKQILALENELKEHKSEIEKYQGIQTLLDRLNGTAIRSSGGGAGAGTKTSHRRQTWGGAGDATSLIPLHVDSPNLSKPNTMRDHRALESLQSLENGEGAKCNGDAQEMKTIDESWTDTSVFKVPSKMPTMKRSLLATPTSFRSPVHRSNCMLIAHSFPCFLIDTLPNRK